MNAPTTIDDGVITEMPGLRIEASHREDMVILEQGPARVVVHAVQARLIAEHLGLLPAVDSWSQLHAKTITTLARRLRSLKARIDHLGHYLHHCSDAEHANLDYEMTYSMASCEIADEFCQDLDDADAPTAACRDPELAVVSPGQRARVPHVSPGTDEGQGGDTAAVQSLAAAGTSLAAASLGDGKCHAESIPSTSRAARAARDEDQPGLAL